MNIDVSIELIGDAQLPNYQTPGAAGMDLCCAQSFMLQPGQRMLVPTGVKLAIPEGYEGQIRPRSGLAMKNGISIVNAPGTIDSDYRGEIGVLLINLGLFPITFEAGDRIAQIVFAPVAKATFVNVHNVSELKTERGEGGFGSTGVTAIEMSIMSRGKVETALSDGRVIEGHISMTQDEYEGLVTFLKEN